MSSSVNSPNNLSIFRPLQARIVFSYGTVSFDQSPCLLLPRSQGLYDSCLRMLNMRCLSIVFDLDETLIVANTMKLFEDRIETLRYIENDVVTDNGKMYKVQLEDVLRSSDGHERVVRPVIRLPEKKYCSNSHQSGDSIIKCACEIKAGMGRFEKLLNSKGRKRFEVYVCTMAERDYALEMWRLLDPEAHLIASKQLSDRVVCVKSGKAHSLYSLDSVTPFQSYVWQEMLHAMSEVVFSIFYEDEVKSLPPTPDVSNYMMTEDSGFVPNGNNIAPFSEGMSGIEAERRLHQSDGKTVMESAPHSITNSAELRTEISQPNVAIIPNVAGPTLSATLLPSQTIPLSSLQPQGGWLVEEDTSRAQSNNRPSATAQELDSLKSDKLRGLQNPLAHGASASAPAPSSLVSHASELKAEEGLSEAIAGNDMHKQIVPAGEAGMSQNHVSSSSREFQAEAGKLNLLPSHLSIGVLQEIGRRCRSKVEFKSVVSTSKDLQFSVEVLFTGEKIGVGMGKTRKDAQQQAAENALHSLAEKYAAYVSPNSGAVDGDFDKLSIGNENGFVWDISSPESSDLVREDGSAKERPSEVADAELVNTSNMVNQQQQKRANSLGQADSSRGTAFGWKLGVSSDTKNMPAYGAIQLGD
ncbi:hypothetical protein H0E87_026666 [Populus deltoides]|uniref:protein-serine/threonine phosphatase n=1 Tax=Populus deltoides TaxID=3696 RepID=A0A8T2WXT7_POPDE|nr:hypothetical protein H0E87_026666 [Populus deltoides]